MERLTAHIAGITLHIEATAGAGLARFAPWQGPALPDCLSLRLHAKAEVDPHHDAPLLLARDGLRLTYRGRSARGWLDLARGEAEAEVLPGPGSLDGFLRFVFSELLLARGGLLLHGAAVVREDRGYLFLGESGAGKSTIAQLCASTGALVLGDEVVALRPDGSGSARVYGTPLGTRRGHPGAPGDGRVAAIGLLEQAPAPSFRKVTPTELAAALLKRTLAWPELTEPDRLLDTTLALATRTTGGRLAFRLAPDFWDVLP